ncbi:MAG: hypothetical protein ABS46_06215 [Cytophagaceae bacterium SCN 52-12]|nr:MAG: hypothetical protein ABS46_06215 [Cytophagaceae bacterium SCN 52-12]
MTKHLTSFLLWGLTTVFTGMLPFPDANAQQLAYAIQHVKPATVLKETKLKNALLILQQHYGAEILFEDRIVDPVSIFTEDIDLRISLEKNLDRLLNSTDLSYKKMRKKTYVIHRQTPAPAKESGRSEGTGTSALPWGGGLAGTSVSGSDIRAILSEKTVSGKVTDEANEPLPGVNIMVKGSQTGTVSGIDGSFSISLPEAEATLIFSFVGYLTEEIIVNNQTRIEVTLKVDERALEEVVVVGYGAQRKVNMTGAVGVIETKQIENRPIASAEEALQGQIAGLNVVRTGGQPGNQSIDFRIRGTSTFTSNPVLTIIDGVPSSLDRINPNDIESISVLKDAASAAIYGTRASGGVILVTTKSGKSGTPKISVSSSIGIQLPTRFPEKVSALDHALLSNEARANDGAGPKFTDEQIRRFSSPDWTDIDWDSYMFRNSLQTNQNVSIAGGSDTHDYYLSLGYLKQDGIIINTGFERFNLQLNQNIKLTRKLKLGIKAGYIPSTRTAPGGGNLGNMLSFVAAQPNFDDVRTADGRWLQNSTNTGGGNPIALASEDGGQQVLKSGRIQGNFSLDYEILPKLKLTGIYGIVNDQSRQRDYRKKITLYRQDNHDQVASQSAFNYLDVNNSREIFQNVNLLANYENKSGDHHYSIMGGTTAEWFLRGNDAISTRDFLTDNIYTVNAGSGDPSLWNISGGASDWALASVIARATYSFKNRYLLESSFRYDGSSRFADGLKWGFFPSVSAGWIMSEEDIFKSDILTFLKLRGSWGRVGNQNVGFYPFANTLAQTSYFFNGSARRGVTTAGAPNPLLTWETKESFNIGFDGSLWNNILEFSVDLFKERTSDILLQLPLPTTFGQSEPVQNVGTIDNRGWELELRHRKSIGAFSYGVSFQVSDATNKVIDMGGVSPRIANNTITEEGRPMNEWFGWRATGFFQSDEEVANASFQTARTSPGDIRYQENGGNPNTITSDDRVRLGRSDPRFPYGIRLNMGYKNFDLRLFGQGVMSHLVWSNGWTANNFDRENSTLRTYHLDRWTPETPNARFPKTRMGSGAGRSGINDSFSSFWLEDASYFRLKHIELGYNLPASLLKKLKIPGLRLLVSGENLLTFSDFLGYDPETPTGTAARLVESRYPLSKVFNFGINLNF